MSEVTYTRSKRGQKPPRAKDLIAWRHNGAPHPELVIRSPADPNVWLDAAGRAALMASLSREETPFTSSHGKRPLLRPEPGQYGWFRSRNPRRHSLDRCIFTKDGTWEPAPVHASDDF